VRFVAVDSANDVDAARAVDDALARAEGADRLLFFGAAAHFAARRARAERDAREGQWLGAAAAWLLDDDAPPAAPARPAEAPLKKATAVVPLRTDLVGMARADHVLELAGGLIVMAVPDEGAIDAVDNAHLWLVGGGATFRIDHKGSRAVVTVGAGVVVVDVMAGDVTVAVVDADGRVEEHVVGLQVTNKMSVRGAG
jgi:hypothetical protein